MSTKVRNSDGFFKEFSFFCCFCSMNFGKDTFFSFFSRYFACVWWLWCFFFFFKCLDSCFPKDIISNNLIWLHSHIIFIIVTNNDQWFFRGMCQTNWPCSMQLILSCRVATTIWNAGVIPLFVVKRRHQGRTPMFLHQFGTKQVTNSISKCQFQHQFQISIPKGFQQQQQETLIIRPQLLSFQSPWIFQLHTKNVISKFPCFYLMERDKWWKHGTAGEKRDT